MTRQPRCRRRSGGVPERGIWYLGVRDLGGGRLSLFLEACDGGSTRTLASHDVPASAALRLKIAGNEGAYAFSFDTGDGRAGNCSQATWTAPF